MQFHQLKPTHKTRKRKRVGRGGKRGSYSGKGIKGQKSRAGHRIRPQLRDILKKFPKRRGSGKSSRQVSLASRNFAVINLGDLDKNFENGSKVSPSILVQRKLIRRVSGKPPAVKILGSGSLEKSLSVVDCLVSQKAKTALEKAGGSVK